MGMDRKTHTRSSCIFVWKCCKTWHCILCRGGGACAPPIFWDLAPMQYLLNSKFLFSASPSNVNLLTTLKLPSWFNTYVCSAKTIQTTHVKMWLTSQPVWIHNENVLKKERETTRASSFPDSRASRDFGIENDRSRDPGIITGYFLL